MLMVVALAKPNVSVIPRAWLLAKITAKRPQSEKA
jgi:hypothetical protein